MAKAKKAEPKKEPTLAEKRKEIEKNSVTKRKITRSPTPKTKWDPETKKRVRRVAKEEAEKVDRDKPKRLSAETATNGLNQPVGIDMYTASLPTGMPAQSFSRADAPKPFDVQVRPDGKLYVYSPIWNTYEVKLGSASGAKAEEGKWNEVGTPDTGNTLYAVQEDTLDSSGEVKSSAFYLSFNPGAASAAVKYTSVKVAKKFDALGWRALASGALVTGSGGSVTVTEKPLAWTVQNRMDGEETKGSWKVFSPAWVDGSTTKLPGSAGLGKWTSLGISSGEVYAVYKEMSTVPGEGESEEDVTWSFASLTISGSVGVNTPPTAPSGGSGGTGSAGVRYTNVPIGKFEGGGFTQYHEGVIVSGYPGGGGGGATEGGSSDGPSWGYGPVEWDNANQRFIQYKGTFDSSGTFTCSGDPTVVFTVKSHRDDHTQGII